MLVPDGDHSIEKLQARRDALDGYKESLTERRKAHYRIQSRRRDKTIAAGTDNDENVPIAAAQTPSLTVVALVTLEEQVLITVDEMDRRDES